MDIFDGVRNFIFFLVFFKSFREKSHILTLLLLPVEMLPPPELIVRSEKLFGFLILLYINFVIIMYELY